MPPVFSGYLFDSQPWHAISLTSRKRLKGIYIHGAMNSMKLVIPLQENKTLNNAVTPQRQSQFTPKMKANAVPRLLSSLV